MNLLENAYDFLNSSLLFYRYSEEDPRKWKVAFINIVQSIELMAKEKLKRSNKYLIYENIDNPKNTISLHVALDRMLNILELPLDNKDIDTLKKAISLRNQMMHYEIDFSVHELMAKYSVLFEFATSFHFRFLDGELHNFIEEHLWEEEANLMEFFKQEFFVYNSEEVHRRFPKDFIESKYIEDYLIQGVAYPRIGYGEERYEEELRHTRATCADCMVKLGEFHVPGCDWEQCPKYYGQSIGCGCDDAEDC
ncbi:hypothetical protein [Caldalkalibacillus mannanilyticus]|uniref:hypothetical protein n=1 Tax=Caldalkalibacillus mannanilyticus TaxID=1418 RepID=UPI0011DE4768|nr:hypothetical protein [Caldalkalibacillus mannanilyticus]